MGRDFVRGGAQAARAGWANRAVTPALRFARGGGLACVRGRGGLWWLDSWMAYLNQVEGGAAVSVGLTARLLPCSE